MKTKILSIIILSLLFFGGKVNAQSITLQGAWPSGLSVYDLSSVAYQNYPDHGVGANITCAIEVSSIDLSTSTPYLNIYDNLNNLVSSSTSYSITASYTYSGGSYKNVKFTGITGFTPNSNPYTFEVVVPSASLSSHDTRLYYFHNNYSNIPTLGANINGCEGVSQSLTGFTGKTITSSNSGSITYYWCLKNSAGGFLSANNSAIYTGFTGGTINIPAPNGNASTPFTQIGSNTVPASVTSNCFLHLLIIDGAGVAYEDKVEFIFAKPTLSASTSISCANSSITLTATTCSGLTNPQYEFQKLDNTTTPTWTTIAGPSSSNTTNYTPGNNYITGNLPFRVKVYEGSSTTPGISEQVNVSLYSPNQTYYFGAPTTTTYDSYICANSSSVDLHVTTGSYIWPSLATNQTVQWEKWDVSTSSYVDISGATNLTYVVNQSDLINDEGLYRYRIIEYFPTPNITCSKHSRSNVNVRKVNSLTLLSSNGTQLTSFITPQLYLSNNTTVSNYFVNIQWYRNGVLIPGANSETYNATSKGKYVVVATHPDICDGNIETSNELEITEECSAFTPTYSNSTLSSNQIFYTDLFIDGDLTITSGTDITFQNISVKMFPGSRIVINNGAKLNIDNTIINGTCAGWRGILVDGELSITNNSTISDAQAAVYVDNNNSPIININNAIFSNNHISFYCENSLNTGSINITSSSFFDNALCQLDASPGNTNIDNYYAHICLINSRGSAISTNIGAIGSGNIFTGTSNPISSVANYLLYGENIGGLDLKSNNFNTNNIGIKITEGGFDNKIVQNVFDYFDQYAIVVDKGNSGANDNKLLIRENNFNSNVHKGILMQGISGFRIKMNNFNGSSSSRIERGIECYNDDYNAPTFWLNSNEIALNTFDYVEKGVTIASLYDVFLSGSSYNLHSNSNGSNQNISILCNNFNNNDFGIVGTGTLSDQLISGVDPNNTFTNSNLWDILWYIEGTTPPFNYNTVNPTSINTTPSMPTINFNGYSGGGTLTPFNLTITTSIYDCNIIASSNDEQFSDDVSSGGIIFMNSETTKVKDLNQTTNQLAIYPNPVKDVLTVELYNAQSDRIEIYDILGKIVYSEYVNNQKTKLDISTNNWKDGIYFVKLYNGTNLIGMQKLAKIN